MNAPWPLMLVILLCGMLSFATGQAQDVVRAGTVTVAATAPVGGKRPACCDILQTLQFTSDLPVVLINTGVSVVITKEKRIDSSFCTCGAPGGVDLNGKAGVRVRGSSSARQNLKKSFSLKLTANNGSKLDFPLMGFPSDDEFIMYGPEPDKTLGFRNFLTYEMSRHIGRYASRSQYVEVFLNQNGTAGFTMDHYWGVYIVGEKIKRHTQRVDVQPLREDDKDLSGGYIIKYDNNNIEADEVTFSLGPSQLTMVLVSPEASWVTPTSPTTQWIQEYMNKFDTMLNTTGNWRQYVDELSFVDYFIMTEITKNPDGYRGSVFMHKDKQGPLVAGPMWDYNEAYGLCCGYPIEGYNDLGVSTGLSGGSAISPEGWRFNICQEPQRCLVEPLDGTSQWYRIMFKDPVFVATTAKRWKELRSTKISDQWFTSVMTSATTTLMPAAIRNYNRWAEVLADPTYPTGEALFAGEMKFLLEWTLARVKWLDMAMDQASVRASSGSLPLPAAASVQG